jgi:4-phospho-D-threonate 3-dehydrogenase / 4-phospho-D-erythronate 3-dehydrogenase
LSKKINKIKVGISVGDVNGIGPEIILKSFLDVRMFDFCLPILFCSNKLVNYFKKQLQLDVIVHNMTSIDDVVENKLNVFTFNNETVNIAFGKEDLSTGAYALKSLKIALENLKLNKVDCLLTAPINKNTIQSEDFKFPGHTDFLASQLEGDSLMFMLSGDLRVGLLTDHVPLKDVSSVITPDLIKSKVSTIVNSLKSDFKIPKPKVAVLGLNPHAGDKGVIGKEDDDLLRPVLQEIQKKGDLVYGPYSADSFFGSNSYKSFDAVIASYHDQGLIPFKTLSFGNGVNYTAGLDKVRTSPDHGTAYEIAGKGIADESSFKEALFKAIEIFKNREEYDLLKRNSI